MAHVFRKYLSNRGSALFMVISTMTALLISCMAMYFSMISSRSSQYAVFNQIQSYQSAQSIVDIVRSSIMDPANPGGAALREKMKTLSEGDVITTGANGFASFDPNNGGNRDESQLGAYSVTITCLGPDASGQTQFDIAVMSSVDGNRDVVHQSLGYNESSDFTSGGQSNSPGDSELFAATGYVPNDAYLDGGIFLTNTFFDTEFTYAGAYDNMANYLAGNISTGGNLIFKSYLMSIANHGTFNALSRPTTWAIRGDFDIECNNPLELYDGSKILIGKDMTFSTNGGFMIGNNGTIDIYILGDLNLNSSANFSNINLYVNGDINVINNDWPTFKNVYINGEINCNHPVTVNGERMKWEEATTGWTKDDVIDELELRTNTKDYYKWEISDSEVNASFPIHVKLNSDNAPHDGVAGWSNNFYIAYPGSNTANDTSIDVNQKVVGKGFTINGFDGFVSNNDIPLSIVIDTGNDENNIVTLRVEPYRDINNDGIAETFSWVPSSPSKFCVLVKGRGSVIIDIPDGCTYQDVDRSQVMHYSWMRILGGQEGNRSGSVQNETGGWGDKTIHYYDASGISGGQLVPDLITAGSVKPSLLTAELIHTNCIKGDGCDYTFTSTGTDKCPACNKVYTHIECSKHGDVDYYCPDCNTPKQAKVDRWKNASNSDRAEGFCNNHLDKGLVDQYLNAHSDIKAAISDANGVIYPNVNIYLVTCSESTDIRFSTSVDGTSIIENGFYGYIYAPYVTYKGKGNSGTLCARFCGGLVVSDYVFNDNYPVIACYPDKMPNELAGLEGGGIIGGGMQGTTTKTWKIDIGGYR